MMISLENVNSFSICEITLRAESQKIYSKTMERLLCSFTIFHIVNFVQLIQLSSNLGRKVMGNSAEVVTSHHLNRKVGCSRPIIIRARWLRVSQDYTVEKNKFLITGPKNHRKQSDDEKKQCFFLRKKNCYHTISINENCMTNIFLVVTTKIFPSKLEISPNLFFFSTANSF